MKAADPGTNEYLMVVEKKSKSGYSAWIQTFMATLSRKET
jgi:hypothetical protein